MAEAPESRAPPHVGCRIGNGRRGCYMLGESLLADYVDDDVIKPRRSGVSQNPEIGQLDVQRCLPGRCH